MYAEKSSLAVGRQYRATVSLSCSLAAASRKVAAVGGQLPRSSPTSGWKVVDAPCTAAHRHTHRHRW
jgi:hypothetical protein